MQHSSSPLIEKWAHYLLSFAKPDRYSTAATKTLFIPRASNVYILTPLKDLSSCIEELSFFEPLMYNRTSVLSAQLFTIQWCSQRKHSDCLDFSEGAKDVLISFPVKSVGLKRASFWQDCSSSSYLVHRAMLLSLKHILCNHRDYSWQVGMCGYMAWSSSSPLSPLFFQSLVKNYVVVQQHAGITPIYKYACFVISLLFPMLEITEAALVNVCNC